MIQGRRTRLRRRTYQILEVARGGDTASRAADVFLIVLISANVAAIILESMPAVLAAHRDFFAAFEAFSVAVFTVEYLLRLWAAAEDDRRRGSAARRRLRWAVSPIALCDLLAILPAWLALFVGLDLRFLRVLRLLRLFKLTRYSRAMGLLAQVFREEAATFGTTLFILMVMMILASSGIYLVEREAQPDAFGSIPAAMWWAMATLTTVGYGDVTPTTPLGKLFGACITIVGVGMVALPSGLLASAFSEQLRRRRQQYEQQVDEALEKDKISADDRRKLRSLREELGLSPEQASEILRREAARRRGGEAAKGESANYCPHCGKAL